MRNPRKQVVGAKLKSMTCYLMKSDDPATEKQRKESLGNTRIDKDTPRVRVWRREAMRCLRVHDSAMQTWVRAWVQWHDDGGGRGGVAARHRRGHG